jgi:hypothetical protein
MSNSHQSYNSFQEHVELINSQERKQEKTVKIRNGTGTKTVRYLAPNGRVLAEKTLKLNSEEIDKILGKTFIPELFHPCIGHCMKKINGGSVKAGGRRGHGAIFFTKHKSRKAAASRRRSRRKNY